jgi:hypothetical protein
MFLVACAVESVPVSSQNESALSTPATVSDEAVDLSPTGTPTTNDLACFRRCIADCGGDNDCTEICRCVCLETEYCN